MIDGVKVKKLQRNADERGCLTEILRRDDEIFVQFGQIYATVNYPGVIRAWHYHRKQDDFFAILKGMAKIVLYDAREDSPTKGEVNEFFLGEQNMQLLKVPIGVYHGFKTIGVEPCILINLPTQPYDPADPDEYRLPFNSPEVPYDWDIKMK